MGYEDHRHRLQERAIEAHRKWFANLTPAQRRKLRDLGVLDQPEDDASVDGHNPFEVGDIADSPRASETWEPAEDLDQEHEQLAEQLGVSLDTARKILTWKEEAVEQALEHREGELLAVVVGGLIAARNVKVSTAGLAFAAQLAGVNGFGSQTEFAKKHGLSRQAISKVTKAWQRDLNLKKSVHQKSDKACETYSRIGHKRHWRARKCDAVSLLRKLKKQVPQPQ
jgi:hypothetical protein